MSKWFLRNLFAFDRPCHRCCVSGSTEGHPDDEWPAATSDRFHPRLATPLGLQTFATGRYNVVISDNVDDGDPITDSDSRWIITSQGGGPANASQLLEVEVLAAASVTPMGAVSFSTPTVDLDRKRGLLYPRVLVGTRLWRDTTL